MTRDGEAPWTIEAHDAAGHITRERFSNGAQTTRSWEPLRGHLLRLRTLTGAGVPLQDLR